ncbi:MAG TPA: hypothetical protein VGO64_00405, partial [Candidatus Limnocylindrales bacterium]|nr:hypothetical protein [Candidatus Limnocylindrales bacterium]
MTHDGPPNGCPSYTPGDDLPEREPVVKLAHVRERNGPTGARWRLVAALEGAAGSPAPANPTGDPSIWLDLDIARRRATAADPNLAHDRVLHRQPVTTLDDHLARGLRVEALTELLDGFRRRDEDDDAVLPTA